MATFAMRVTFGCQAPPPMMTSSLPGPRYSALFATSTGATGALAIFSVGFWSGVEVMNVLPVISRLPESAWWCAFRNGCGA